MSRKRLLNALCISAPFLAAGLVALGMHLLPAITTAVFAGLLTITIMLLLTDT